MLKFKEIIKTQPISDFPVRIVVVRGTDPLQIGRDPLCDVHLEHGAVERHHAVLFYEDGYYWLRNVSNDPLCVEAVSATGIFGPASMTKPVSLPPQQEMLMERPVRFLLGDVVVQLMVPVLQPTLEQVRCHGCGRSQDSTRSDCLWCGSSLAFGW